MVTRKMCKTTLMFDVRIWWRLLVVVVFFFFFILFSFTSLSRVFHSSRDEPISRWGKMSFPRFSCFRPTYWLARLDMNEIILKGGLNWIKNSLHHMRTLNMHVVLRIFLIALHVFCLLLKHWNKYKAMHKPRAILNTEALYHSNLIWNGSTQPA